MENEFNTLMELSDSESKRTIDPTSGFLTIKDCILAGAGVLSYRHKEIFKDSASDEVVYLDRPAEAFTKEYVDAWNGKDITLLSHTFLNSSNATKKTVGVVVNAEFADGQLKGDVIVKDKATIEELQKAESKGKYSLSVGQYGKTEDADYEVDGKKVIAKQTIMIPNHLAIVTNPRYKAAALSDSDTTTAVAQEQPIAEATPEPVAEIQFTDEQMAAIEKRAIQLADERVKLLNRVNKEFADYDGTAKTGKEVMVDIIKSAMINNYYEFSQIYKSCFGDLPPENLADVALNIMFNVAIGISTSYRVSLKTTEMSIITPAEGAATTMIKVEDRDTTKTKTASPVTQQVIKTTDSASTYLSPRDAYINNLKKGNK